MASVQRSLWRKPPRQRPAPPAPIAQELHKPFTLATLPDAETPLTIIGDESGAVYALTGTLLCGAGYGAVTVYALLVAYGDRGDPMAMRTVVRLERLEVAIA